MRCCPAMRERLRVFGAVVRDPRLRRIQVAFLAFNMAEFATWIAMLVFAYSRGGAAMAGIVALIQLIPSGLVAPFAAFASDRFRRDRVLFVDYIVQAVALGTTAIALAADAPLAVVYSTAAVAAASLTFTRPAQAALLPVIAGTPEDLTAANVVTGVVEGAGILLGPLFAGVLLERGHPATVFAVFAGVMLLAALSVSRLRVEPATVTPREPMQATDVIHETLAGIATLRRERGPRLLVLVLSASLVLVGGLDVLFVATAIDLLDMGESGAGYLTAAYGLGGIVGAGAAIALVGRARLTPPLAAGAIVAGVPIATVAASSTPAGAAALIVGAGAGRSLAYVAGSTLLQRIAPEEVLARVFGVLEGLGMFALAAGSIAASGLVEALGIRWALVALGAFMPLVTLVSWRAVLAIDRAAEAPDPAVLALLCRSPIFAPLPAPTIERVLRDLVPVRVGAGEIVIREGDPGDRYYVVVDGEVSITRGGRPVAVRGRSDGFGEIALLRDVPRTATVTALTDLELLALERDAFLLAVTGHPESSEAAERVAEERLDP
jgi:MFS family permease